MKRSICLSVFRGAMLGAILLGSASVRAQQAPEPTKEHMELAKDAGVWDADVSMWMKPGGQPMKSKAVETNAMLGKMWLVSKFEGEFGGEKYTGHGQFGYDPMKKKCIGTWIDSMSPFLMVFEGDHDEKTKTSTLVGKGIDHETGKECTVKLVTHFKSNDSKVFEMHKQASGADEWQKTMEITYTRRK